MNPSRARRARRRLPMLATFTKVRYPEILLRWAMNRGGSECAMQSQGHLSWTIKDAPRMNVPGLQFTTDSRHLLARIGDGIVRMWSVRDVMRILDIE